LKIKQILKKKTQKILFVSVSKADLTNQTIGYEFHMLSCETHVRQTIRILIFHSVALIY